MSLGAPPPPRRGPPTRRQASRPFRGRDPRRDRPTAQPCKTPARTPRAHEELGCINFVPWVNPPGHPLATTRCRGAWRCIRRAAWRATSPPGLRCGLNATRPCRGDRTSGAARCKPGATPSAWGRCRPDRRAAMADAHAEPPMPPQRPATPTSRASPAKHQGQPPGRDTSAAPTTKSKPISPSSDPSCAS